MRVDVIPEFVSDLPKDLGAAFSASHAKKDRAAA
jgi:hypothetical protein